MREHKLTEATLRDFYFVLFRHKSRILAVFFAVVITSILITFLSAEIYRSEAALMVRIGRENVLLDPTGITGQDRENEINSELAILRSRSLAEKVVGALGVDIILNVSSVPGEKDTILKKMRYGLKRLMKLPGIALKNIIDANRGPDAVGTLRENEIAILSLMKNLSVEAAKKSSIITIAYEAESPEAANSVVTKIIDIYLEMHFNVHRTKGSYQFLDQQKEELRRALSTTENELKNLKNRSGVAVLFDQRRILLERIGGLQQELEKTESDIAVSTAAIKSLTRKLSGIPQSMVTTETTGLPNSANDEMRKRLYELQLKEQELHSTFTEDSIPVKEIRRQIAEGQSLLQKAGQARQVTTGINATYQEMLLILTKEEGSLPTLHAKAVSIKDQLAKSGDELKALNETEILMTQLQREQEILESNYRKYSESLEQSRIDRELEIEKISNISVLQTASCSIKPVRPRKVLNLLLGIIIGFFGGLALAFITENMDHSFKRPDDVDGKLKIPLLATIPLLPSENILSLPVPIQQAPPMPGSLQMSAQNILPKPINALNCSEFLRECFHQSADNPLKTLCTIAVTSCHTGEGVSTVVASIAQLLLEQRDGRVFVVDAHLGRSTRSADLKSLAKLLPGLKRKYSHIIFDLPSLCEDTTGILLASVMDTVVLVVEAEKTRLEVVQDTIDRLLQARSNVFGVILNKRRFYVPEWLYRTI